MCVCVCAAPVLVLAPSGAARHARAVRLEGGELRLRATHVLFERGAAEEVQPVAVDVRVVTAVEPAEEGVVLRRRAALPVAVAITSEQRGLGEKPVDPARAHGEAVALGEQERVVSLLENRKKAVEHGGRALEVAPAVVEPHRY